ncbi:hypothetical protein KJ758_01735 [Patescibacteria group bacterium]|nr:hypothetical protein [Patescibacteria group bacterium]
MKNESQENPVSSGASKNKWLLWIGIPVAVLLIATAFVMGIWLASNQAREEVVVEETTEGTDETTELVEETEEPVELDVSVGEQALKIDWLALKDQVEVDPTRLLDDALAVPLPDWADSVTTPTAYKLGTVQGGVYDGFTLAEEYFTQMGMGEFYTTVYTLTDPTGEVPTVILDRYAEQSGFSRIASGYRSAREVLSNQLADLGTDVRFDAGAVIAEFEQSLSAKDTRGQNYIFHGVTMRYNFPDEFSYTDYAPTATLENGRVLRLVDDKEQFNLNDGFISLREDGRMMVYELKIPFWPEVSSAFASPAIYWNSGGYNREEYSKALVGGCGINGLLDVVDKSEIGELKEVGYYVVSNNVHKAIYEPVNWESGYYQQDFINWQYWAGQDKTMADFILIHPVFYYQDSLGRWIEFTNSAIMPMAECGKPVIYLYPEATTDIDVSLAPAGGFTYTEPVYNNGWRVTASPDGTLVNRDDGEVYSYLFWEGRGGLYSAPEYYWVVEQPAVEKFLVEKLHEFGFTSKETVDFMDFWYPRMQNAPWYKIGFHGTQMMDMLAPMTLSQPADSVLRVLMDFDELNASIEANPLPTIPHFERNGFTVTEWGGVLK